MPQKKKGGKKKKQSKQSKKVGKSNTDALSEETETGENNNENNTAEEETIPIPVPQFDLSKDQIISTGRDLILNALKTGGEAKARTLHFVGSPKCSNPACDIGEAEVKLKACSRCHKAMYCSVKCQRKHWAEHKPLCKQFENRANQMLGLQEKISPKKNTQNTLHPHIIAETEKNKKLLKDNRYFLGDDVLSECVTAFGIVRPGEPLPDGVPSKFHLSEHAVVCFNSSDELSRVFKYERVYLEYFQEIVKNEEEWMEFFSCHSYHYDRLEDTFVILLTLARIWRYRGGSVFHKKCEEVLDLLMRILPVYKESRDKMVALSDSLKLNKNSIVSLFESQQSNYEFLRFELYIDTKQDDLAAYYLRKVLEYEMSRTDPGENKILPKLYFIGFNPTVESVQNQTDSEMKDMAMLLGFLTRTTMIEAIENEKRSVALMKCEACNKMEDAIGDFRTCSRCSCVYYCSSECQKNHYEIHKRSCKKK